MVNKLLCAEHIGVHFKNSHGQTPIHFAISGPDHSATEFEILLELLSKLRVDITVWDKRGRNVLSYAAVVCGTKSGFNREGTSILYAVNIRGDRNANVWLHDPRAVRTTPAAYVRTVQIG